MSVLVGIGCDRSHQSLQQGARLPDRGVPLPPEMRLLRYMVGSWGLEPQASTVSKPRDQVVPTTWEALGIA
jgi:hypothetical protein